MSNPKETVTFKDCRLVATSKAAILVASKFWENPIWFPESQVDDDSDLYLGCLIGDTGKLVVTKWIAQQKGLFDLDD